ncbi:Uncharacterised protein [Citrobacter werkmanii]|uniref:Uncharacterized protein n=1 Tax=Citrobacter werkmanii TaxID=67827 RepID=A0A9N8CSJ3_9ENTR|nr:Uncharacterised protein [Citrobacter werkmanii]CAB5578277.1 Uncharacterised protein [Citrobacter werkmanii]CAB5591332.1 Uncharacterised protein [Citrobacter werkmanii]CAB5591645.1 Uncharacterised protein [Citrobacter werkmanii]CAB5591956.1 Uncharacterised protein [Citrobacter werkmanii]
MAVRTAPKRGLEMKITTLMLVLAIVLSTFATKGPAINISGNTLQFGSFTQTK